MREKILRDDGENLAVRAFLGLYKMQVSTVGTMARHMEALGWDNHPSWATEADSQHLTVGGAQLWIRHLISLETPPPVVGLPTWICPRCKVDRITTPCVFHNNVTRMIVECPMTATAQNEG